MTAARTLILDIETSPNVAFVWTLWKPTIALNQIESTGQVISFAYRWHGEKPVRFHSIYDFDGQALNDGSEMVSAAHALMDEADIVVTWNGNAFDLPHLNREFILAGLQPPAPTKSVDLCLAVRKHFKFTSNKLDHVAQQLGVGAKTPHPGFTLWRDCMDGDVKAWRLMRRYNKHDVEITDGVYGQLRPYIPHPHVGLYDASGAVQCGKCGSRNLQRRGYATTLVGRFQRYQCVACGAWSREASRVAGVDLRPVT